MFQGITFYLKGGSWKPPKTKPNEEVRWKRKRRKLPE